MDTKLFRENEELLKADEVSRYLRIPRSTIYRLSQTGKIKAVKIGKHWRYIKEDIEKHISFGTVFSKGPARKPNNFNYSLHEGGGFVEHRVFPRINSNFKCKYSINLIPFKNITSLGIIKDLSAGGVFLFDQSESMGAVKIDDPIHLEFLLILDNDRRINIEVKGKVVRKARDGLGIKFKNINREMQDRIMEYAG